MPDLVSFQSCDPNCAAMASLNLKGCMVIDDDFEGYPKVNNALVNLPPPNLETIVHCQASASAYI
jgi:hypothetical protein